MPTLSGRNKTRFAHAFEAQDKDNSRSENLTLNLNLNPNPNLIGGRRIRLNRSEQRESQTQHDQPNAGAGYLIRHGTTGGLRECRRCIRGTTLTRDDGAGS